jgi:hypothetical protein
LRFLRKANVQVYRICERFFSTLLGQSFLDVGLRNSKLPGYRGGLDASFERCPYRVQLPLRQTASCLKRWLTLALR